MNISQSLEKLTSLHVEITRFGKFPEEVRRKNIDSMKESEIIFYTTPSGDVKIDIRFEDETFWLTQKKLAELFDVEVNTINYHLKEIFKSGELDEAVTVRKIRIVQTEGTREVQSNVEFYDLDDPLRTGGKKSLSQ